MKAALIIGGILAILIALTLFAMNGMEDIKKLVINEVDLSKVADGTYTGSFHKGRWTYDVEVTVKDHKIVSAKNVNQKMDMNKDFNTKVESEIIAKQTPKIDAVSGGSINTKAFGKAVENALTPKE